jgi:hypothetical protein
VLQLEALDDRHVHLVLELLDAVLALPLREIHRQVGVAQELVARVTLDPKGDAHAHRRGDLLTGHGDGLAQRLHQSRGHVHDLFTVRRVLDEDGELVTTEARGGVGAAKARRRASRHDVQEFVARPSGRGCR